MPALPVVEELSLAFVIVAAVWFAVGEEAKERPPRKAAATAEAWLECSRRRKTKREAAVRAKEMKSMETT
jgi:hypothetical protein